MGSSHIKGLIVLSQIWLLGFSPPLLISDSEAWLPSSQGTYAIRYQPIPSNIPLNESFALEIWITQDGKPLGDDVTLSVDARMPHHRHGMVRQPQLTRLGAGHYRVTEMLFHMPGRWELYFDLTAHGMTERTRAVVTLE